MKTIRFCIGCLLMLALSAQASNRPNIILILADDLGVENLGVYGGESYKTPNLDQLAHEGMRFERFHSNPLCTPSRVKLMTGKYNFRNYQDFMVLPKGETTFGHAMTELGYRTLIAGKWQLHSSGFEEQKGMLPEESGFEDYRLWQVKREDRGSRYWGPTLVTNGQPETFPEDHFGPDLINDYVLNYITEHQNEPFFIYYPMILPHDPFVSTPDHPDADSKEEKYAAMMSYMDKLVGKVKAKLIEQGLADNTVLLFLGDNGTSYRISSMRNGVNINGGKGQTTNNGTHVPFIAWWQGTIGSDSVNHELINLNDFFPTLLELAGGKSKTDLKLDGTSLAPLFYGQPSLGRQSVFIHYDPKAYLFKSARYAFNEDWKLYEDGRFFHTTSDPQENNDLSLAVMDDTQQAAHDLLQSRLASMGGEPVSGFYSLPAKIITRAFQLGAVILVLILGVMTWRRFRNKRKSANRTG
ncbi:sulfatase-like hydrolase/transferase [Endozoicomonas arenosclerae]|uniref:sulfatase-like hydrolase/transferase n=1 Tax=Endozoicomonas arenosclerae TaxID=1633495 RepID=UPI0009A14D95|nr:sulfatase-like hydrolase/transferase [Endozoicomonas arenosclerae]